MQKMIQMGRKASRPYADPYLQQKSKQGTKACVESSLPAAFAKSPLKGGLSE